MAKKRDKFWWRAYRKRKRERKEREATIKVTTEFVNSATGERSPPAPLSTAQPIAPPERGTGAPVALRPHPGAQQRLMEEPPGDLVSIGGQPTGAQVALPRRKHMKSGKAIKSHIASCMRMYGQQPSALLHVLAGYVEQLQEDLKHDAENVFADRVCEKRHPKSPAEGVYCRACHDAEMAGRFGTLPPEFAAAGPTGHSGEELVFPGEEPDEAPGGGGSDEDIALDLEGVTIKPPREE